MLQRARRRADESEPYIYLALLSGRDRRAPPAERSAKPPERLLVRERMRGGGSKRLLGPKAPPGVAAGGDVAGEGAAAGAAGDFQGQGLRDWISEKGDLVWWRGGARPVDIRLLAGS